MGLRKKVKLFFTKPISQPGRLIWNVAMAGFFISASVSAIRLAIPFSLELVVYLPLGLALIPGIFYSLLEFARIDPEAESMMNGAAKVMTACIVTFMAGFVLTSISNMAVVLVEFPFYSLVRWAVRVADAVATLVLGMCAVMVRKRLPYVVLEEEGPPSQIKKSLGGILAATGILLVFSGLFLGYVPVAPLVGLILLLVGLISFSIGLMVLHMRKTGTR